MKRVQGILVDKAGKMCLGWRLMIGILAYVLAFYGVLWGCSAIFGALFEAWNLTNENLIYAPGWARQIVLWHTDATYALAYCASASAALLLAKRWNKERKSSGKEIGRATLMGVGLGALLTAIALGFDSMRLEASLGELSIFSSTFSALAVLMLGSLCGETLTKLLVFDAVRERLGRVWGYAAVAILSVLLAGMWTNPVGLINALLLGIVGCAVYERGGLFASAALSAGWSAWTTWLFAWPGTGASVYRMYTVSDAWLTGGNAGANAGLGATVGWIIIATLLFREDFARGTVKRKHEKNI